MKTSTIIIMVLVLAAMGGGYYFWKKKQGQAKTPEAPNPSAKTPPVSGNIKK